MVTKFGLLASRMRNCADDGDAHPDAPHIGDRRKGRKGKIGLEALSDQMTRTDAVAGIGNALELLDGGLIDLTKKGEKEPGSALRMASDRDQPESAFHLLAPRPRPSRRERSPGLKASTPYTMCPCGVKRGSEDSKVRPHSSCFRPTREECLMPGLRDTDSLTGRARNIDQIYQQVAHILCKEEK